MQRWAVPRFMDRVGANSISIFCKAEASASGWRVSSALPASARYSRSRETAIASTWAMTGARNAVPSQSNSKGKRVSPFQPRVRAP